MKTSLFTLAKSPLGEFIVGIAFGRFSQLIPVERVFENDKILAFFHPKPYWERHILIVPKKAIRSLDSATTSDFEFINEAMQVANKIILEMEMEKTDYTIVTNGGKRQEVPQLHFHLGSGAVKGP